MSLLTDNIVLDLSVLLSSLMVLGVWYVRHSYGYWKRKNVPFLKPKFPLGNNTSLFPKGIAVGIVSRSFYEQFKKMGLKYGGVFLGLRPHLILLDPAHIKDVMTKDFSNFTDRGVYQTTSDPLSVTIFSQSGNDWKNARTKFGAVFTTVKIKSMFYAVVECAAGLEEALDTYALRNSDVDIMETMASLTTDVIGSCAFGISCNSFKHPDAEFRRMGRKLFEEFNLSDQINLFMTINMPKLANKLGIPNIQKEVSKFFFQSVRETVDFREKNNVRRNDFLQLLMDMKNSTDASVKINMNEVTAQAFLFFVAGFETSATTASMALFEISNDKEVQDRAREEILRVLEKHNNDITYEGIAEMKYLGQVVDETLRLWPPVTTLTRVCTKDYTFDDIDLTVEKDVTVLIPTLGLHHDPEYWPDPTRWDPDRFSEENRDARTPFTYLPFGEGPRNCIGLRFGLMQTKIALASILRRYRVSPSPKTVTPLGMDPDTHREHRNIWSPSAAMSLLTDNIVLDLGVLLSSLMVLGVWYVRHSYGYWKRKNVPFLKPKFPLGNNTSFLPKGIAVGIVSRSFYEQFKKMGLKYGGVFLGLRPHLILLDPAHIKDIMTKDFSNFTDRGVYQTTSDPLSVTLFSQSGTDWKNARTKFTAIFTTAKMKSMFYAVVECTAGLEKALDTFAHEKSDVEVIETLACFTTDVIGSCVFGISCNSFKHSDAEFRRMGRKLFDEFTLSDQINLFMTINMPKLANKLGIPNIQKEVSKFFFQSVRETVDFREKDNVRRNDFLQLLIDMKNSTDASVKIDMNEVTAQAFLFFAAGFETSATTASMALFEISNDKEVQDRAREEILRVVEKHNNDITYEGIAEMKYLGQVVDETLRLWPPVTTLTRVCTKDFTFEDIDLTVEKDVPVLIPTLGLHHDPEYWPDPTRWDPDRFSEENRDARTPFTYLPFGEGPRNCIGLRFGLMQTKIALASILRRYRVSPSPKTVTPLGIDPDTFILHTINKVYLKFERIN
ncbi:hypothetical protein NQ317_002092 [Molorchus minor]|uniref:Cytochrome P450 n=1 Tax=Molorchus minor TaxID=1323400 RepID=A0ABQ9JWY6_9CUCU|nr:hypothetical protein NQ317_002092 [Molorchus minor]